jgi:hypothetical protein
VLRRKLKMNASKNTVNSFLLHSFKKKMLNATYCPQAWEVKRTENAKNFFFRYLPKKEEEFYIL